jgi:putative inorganic carbon (hco3(-)) transporter
MKKKMTAKKIVTKKIQLTDFQWHHYLIFFIAILVPTYIPDFHSLEKAGIKFLSIVVIGILSIFIIFLTDKKDRWRLIDLRNPLILVYITWLFISMVSFFKAWNIFESIIQFSEMLGVFTLTIVFSYFIKKDKNCIEAMGILFLFMLFIDSAAVFVSIIQFINKGSPGIGGISFIYSNKNILASAIFLKVCIAIWLYFSKKNIVRFASLAGIFFGLLAIFFLATRTFLMGSILVFALTLFYLIHELRNNNKEVLREFAGFAIIFISAFLLSIFIQKTQYPNPKIDKEYNKTTTERMAMISPNDESAIARLNGWKNSIILIKSNPVLGVGLGNWKIRELTYENLQVTTANYQYKAHNDFLEVTTDTGIPGGLVFLLLLISPLLLLGRSISSKGDGNSMQYTILAALGMTGYLMDSFFNFPLTRPEIQIFMAFFLGIAVNASTVKNGSRPNRHVYLEKLALSFVLVVMMGAVIVLFTYFQSLRFQRIAKDDIRSEKYGESAEYMLSGFPAFPTVSAYGEPISCLKTRYLWNEKRYDDAIHLLQQDNSYPSNNARIFEFIYLSYHYKGDDDSTLKYLNKCLRLKPLFYKYTAGTCSILKSKKRFTEAIEYYNNYLSINKSEPDAWKDLGITYYTMENYGKAISVLDQGLSYIKGDTSLISLKRKIVDGSNRNKYKDMIARGDKFLDQKKYNDAILIYSALLEKDSTIEKALEHRALCYYYQGNYKNSIQDFTTLIQRYPTYGKYYNNRGAALAAVKKYPEACADFEKANHLGDKNALNNYKRYNKLK